MLFYNIYTSTVGDASQNTRLNITNTNSTKSVNVHFFFVRGIDCTIADTYVCLTANQTFSFLGVQFINGERVSRVRITTGSQILTAGSNTGDAVVMDDFIYAEPMVSVVPEPGTVVLLAFGMLSIGALQRRARELSS